MQKTLSEQVVIEGVGLHTGLSAQLVLKPAPENTGILFYRTDVPPHHACIPAKWDYVHDTMLCTKLTNEADVSIGTIEHLMAALFACDIDNIIIEIDGPEVPIMDGSSEPFVNAIEKVGVVEQAEPRIVIEILKPIRVEDSDSRWVSLEPDHKLSMDCQFTFQDRASLPTQAYQFDGNPESFKRDIIRARTFGFLQDIEKLWQMGLAKGGSLENAILIDGSRIVNDEGLRFVNECVRHKVLDAIGDLLLAGYRIQGKLTGRQSGHGLMNKLLRKLFADPSAWRIKKEMLQPENNLAVFVSPLKRVRALRRPLPKESIQAL